MVCITHDLDDLSQDSGERGLCEEIASSAPSVAGLRNLAAVHDKFAFVILRCSAC